MLFRAPDFVKFRVEIDTKSGPDVVPTVVVSC